MDLHPISVSHNVHTVDLENDRCPSPYKSCSTLWRVVFPYDLGILEQQNRIAPSQCSFRSCHKNPELDMRIYLRIPLVKNPLGSSHYSIFALGGPCCLFFVAHDSANYASRTLSAPSFQTETDVPLLPSF